MTGRVVLIPTVLADNATETIPGYVTDAVKDCSLFFVENERTARRFLKSIWREMVIDDYAWFTIHKAEESVLEAFRQALRSGKTIGILSEAGCPGVADPGQLLVAAAQEMQAVVRPLVGPSSILLALMASGMNGQEFRFTGYLPIDAVQRTKELKELEAESKKRNCTMIFIETPYRNNPLLETLLEQLADSTRVCVAADLTAPGEQIRTMTVEAWKKWKTPMELHKRPAIFLLLA